VHGGDGEVAVSLELPNVGLTNAVGLNGLDVDDVAVLLVRLVTLAMAAVRRLSRRYVCRRHWRLRKACWVMRDGGKRVCKGRRCKVSK
jgi:hypothetical protein